MNYEEMYQEDVKLYVNIKKRFEVLQETDIAGAFQLMKDAYVVAERWAKIKYDIKKDLKRGEGAAFKERLDDMCKYLKEIATTSRMIWNNGNKDLRNGVY
ncbi:MAG: hypothetical protein Q8936_16615 [Bacillota bacterium]|nr:hypothetical protein [Bacillota bacterium]